MTWKHRMLPSAADLEAHPPAFSPAAAQEWSNFIVWAPHALPADCAFAAGTLRKEAPPGRVGEATAGRSPWSDANPAAYRFLLRGNGRSLRVKQFLYDWAFPALDHPCLWESATHAVSLPDGDAVWFGTDYASHPGASSRRGRTMLELSVLEGTFDESELLELFAGLRPVSAEAAEKIAATRFSRLSYWARRDAPPMSVPIGLWKLDRSQPDSRQDWADDPAAMAAETGSPIALAGYVLDDIAGFSAGDVGEIEAIYTEPEHRGRELRLIAQPAGAGRMRVPAEPSTHPAPRETLSRYGTSVQFGEIDARFGPFDAVWASGGMDYRLLSTTGVGMDREWFLGAVDALVQAGRA